MSELRLNQATGEWVVFAPERARRPEDFQRQNPEWTHQEATWSGHCPFCPGQDARTPGETLCLTDSVGNWQVRAFPNRYPAVSPGARPLPEGEEMSRSLRGVGHHEVIAESPLHNTTLGLMSATRVGLVLRAWRQRYRTFWLQPETEHVVIFKNHGRSAGCSLKHPHSQVVALPVTPLQVLQRLEVSNRYYHQHGRCVFCDELEWELRQEKRIICQSAGFVAYVPYASFSPFSIWVVPRRHHSSFANLSDLELEELATMLQALLARLYHGLGDPDYNLVIRSTHPEIMGARMCHWYLTIVPRLTRMAGFELGTGMFINTSIPESDAEFLRRVALPAEPPEAEPLADQRVDQPQQTVEIVDKENHTVGHVPRSEMRKKNLLHRAVKILVQNSQGQVFVHRRTSTKDLFPGMHDPFVGGVVESGESYEVAMARVLQSEVGIPSESPMILGNFLHQGARSRAWVQVSRVGWDGPIVCHPDHIEWSSWIPVQEVAAWMHQVAVVPMSLDCFFTFQKAIENP